MERRWVSSREAAAELGISLRTLQSLLVRGLIVGATRLGTGRRAPWMIPSPVIRIRADRGPRARPGTPAHMLKRARPDRGPRRRRGPHAIGGSADHPEPKQLVVRLSRWLRFRPAARLRQWGTVRRRGCGNQTLGHYFLHLDVLSRVVCHVSQLRIHSIVECGKQPDV